jgi:membrane protein implicated in regulation of membrane protease activity
MAALANGRGIAFRRGRLALCVGVAISLLPFALVETGASVFIPALVLLWPGEFVGYLIGGTNDKPLTLVIIFCTNAIFYAAAAYLTLQRIENWKRKAKTRATGQASNL